MSAHEYDIAIAGGGMVGLSLSYLLAQALPDKSIALIDKHAPSSPSGQVFTTRFDAKTTAISAQSVATFKSMGLWQTLCAHVTPILRVHVSDRGHLGSASYSLDDNQGEPVGYVIENDWLTGCLAETIASEKAIDCLWRSEVEGVVIDQHGAHLDLRCDERSETLRCQLLIIADGAQSRLRDTLGVLCDTHDYRQSAVIANVEFEQCHQGQAFERFTSEGPLALLPMGESDQARRAALVWTTPSSAVDEKLTWDEQTFLLRLQESFGFRLGKFTRASSRKAFPLQRVIAREQVRSSLVIMGNAAHFLHPVAGQGFNLALRDAVALCHCLKSANESGASISSYKTLRNYAEAQTIDQWATISLSHEFIRVFSRDDFGAKLVRNLGLLSMSAAKPVKHSFFRQMMGWGDLVRQLK